MGIVPIVHGAAEVLDGLFHFMLQLDDLFTGGLEFLAERLHVLLRGLFPGFVCGMEFVLRLGK